MLLALQNLMLLDPKQGPPFWQIPPVAQIVSESLGLAMEPATENFNVEEGLGAINW